MSGPNAAHDRLLRALNALGEPAPAYARERTRARSSTVVEQIAAVVRSLASRSRVDAPAVAPALAAGARMVVHHLAPCVAAVLLIVIARAPSAVLALLLLATCAMCASSWQLRRSLWCAGPVQPGVYHGAGARAAKIGARLRAVSASYSATRWLWNGDLQTLYPFMCFAKPPSMRYRRCWFAAPSHGDRGDPRRDAPTETEHELLALDWSFPHAGHDPSAPVALVLHGLNGGSAESYVLDFVHVATYEWGWTCVVMNARGLGGTRLRSSQPFHAARTSDVAHALAAIGAAAPGATIVGVGFSLGAVILSNYVGISGRDCALSAAVAVSGCWDNVANDRCTAYGKAVYHPWLALELKRNFLTGEPAATLEAGGRVDLRAARSAATRTISDFDAAVVVPFFGFDDLDDYYRCSSLGHHGKLASAAVPLLAIHAADDPIIDSATFADHLPAITGRTADRPGSHAGNPHLFVLVTRSGGHIGWCEGLAPARRRWGFIHRVVAEFVGAVRDAAREQAREDVSAAGGTCSRASGRGGSRQRRRSSRSPTARPAC